MLATVNAIGDSVLVDVEENSDLSADEKRAARWAVESYRRLMTRYLRYIYRGERNDGLRQSR